MVLEIDEMKEFLNEKVQAYNHPDFIELDPIQIPHLFFHRFSLLHLCLKGSAAKRINMFLRWIVRNDHAGVDFGLWKTISPSKLSCPLDVHTGTIARKLGLLKRKQNDARAVFELDLVLRSFDPEDPVKYDFALFGLGVSEKF